MVRLDPNLAIGGLAARELGAPRRGSDPTGAAGLCPDAEQLAAYVDDGLTDTQREGIEAHLAACTACRRLMATLVPADEPRAEPADVLRPVFRVDWKWLSMAAMVVLAVGVWYAMRPALPRPPSQPMAQSAPARPDAGDVAVADTPRPRAAEPPRAAAKPPPPPGQAASEVADSSNRQATAFTTERFRQQQEAERRLKNQTEAAAAKRRESAEGAKASVQAARAEAPVPAPSPAAAAAAAASERANVPAAAAPAAILTAAPASAGSVFADPERRLLWRIVGGNRIESSSDAGATWTPRHREPSARLVTGSAPSIEVAWAAGARGVVLRRVVPGGWVRVPAPVIETLVSIEASGASHAVVSTASGQRFATRDGGATWTLVP